MKVYQKLLSIKEFRETQAEKAMMSAREKLREAEEACQQSRQDLKHCQEESQIQEEKQYANLMGAKVRLSEIEEVQEYVAQLRKNELDCAEKLAQARKARQDCEMGLEEARKQYRRAQRDKQKYVELIEMQREVMALEAEQKEDIELEDLLVASFGASQES